MNSKATRPLALVATAIIALLAMTGCQSSGYGKGSSQEKFNSVSFMQGYADAEKVANDQSRQLYYSTQGGSCSFMASEWSNSGEIDNFSTSEYVQGCEKRYTELGWTKNTGPSGYDASTACSNGVNADGTCVSNDPETASDSASDSNNSDSGSAEPANPTWKMTSDAKAAISELISSFVQVDVTYTCPSGLVLALNSWDTSCEFTYSDEEGNTITEPTWTGLVESLTGVKVEWQGGYNVYYEFPGGAIG